MSTADSLAPCINCGKESNSSCSTCLIARFCSRECQKVVWPKHKKVCLPPRAQMPTCTGCGGWGIQLLCDDNKCVACGGKGAPISLVSLKESAHHHGHSHGGEECNGHD